MMKLEENNILKVNPYLSISSVDEEKLIVSVKDELKILECEKSTFLSVLQVVDGMKEKKEIIDVFSMEYGKEEVENFIDVLLKEKILIPNRNEEQRIQNKLKVAIAGEGKLFDELLSEFKETFEIVGIYTLLEYVNRSIEKCDTTIVVAGDNTYYEMMQFNKKMVERNASYIIVRYQGDGVTIGPYIFPWKTPCLECHFLHHVRALGLDLDKINTSILNQLRYSFSDVKEYSRFDFKFIAHVIIKEVSKLLLSNQEFQFVRTEKTIYNGQKEFKNIKMYQPISDCRCCHGMNKEFFCYSKKFIDFSDKRNILEESIIKYNKGGFRSKTKEETRNLLENAFKNIGCNIEIKLVKDNPFSSVLPVYDSVIKPTHNNNTPYSLGEQISHGKGLDHEQAYFSAGFEIFERMSARYYGDREIYRASFNEVKNCAINLEHSVKQIKNHNTTYEKYSPHKKIDWVCGNSILTGEKRLIPASMAFLTASVFRGKFFNDTSSGLAAGSTLIDAILQGLLELIEHDAWLIGQCNPLELPLIDLKSIEKMETVRAIEKIESMGYKIICRDYTTDIGIPVFRTWIVNPNNYTLYATSGFGASISPEIAMERSITEAVQSACNQSVEEIIRYESANMRDLIYTRDSIYGLYYFQQKDITSSKNTKIKSIKEYETRCFVSVKEMLEEVILKIKKALPNSDILFYDLTRESIGIPVVRTLVTGDIQRMSLPLIAVSDRLLNFQKRNGASDRALRYEELYMGPYPH